MRPQSEIIELLEWAATQGALSVKIGDVEVLFPPPESSFAAQNPFAPQGGDSYRDWAEYRPLPKVGG